MSTHKEQVLQALIDGRARIAKSWVQGTGWLVFAGEEPPAFERACDQGWGYCMLSAIELSDSIRRNEAAHEAARAALRELRATIGELRLSVWNDAPGRTQAEVLAVYDATIERVRSQ